MTYKIELKDDVAGEIGEAIHHEDHSLSSESYHYEHGTVLEVAPYDTDSSDWHIFTDLQSGHRFKVQPDQYEAVS